MGSIGRKESMGGGVEKVVGSVGLVEEIEGVGVAGGVVMKRYLRK